MFGYTVEQWLQLDVGPPSLVTAIVTKGRGDTGRRQWVTRYRVAYSNDSQVWTFYREPASTGIQVTSISTSNGTCANNLWQMTKIKRCEKWQFILGAKSFY